ncbi:MAG: hypothetical protein IMW89_05580 [Ktedonobacteraceae bacterium]|nr:hypothetical protein [Ktedonobacteraceae bacterium]
MQQQQQQYADYDLLAVFSDEEKANTAAAKLHKEGFTDEEVHQLAAGSIGRGEFREHGPDQTRREFFLQTQRSGPNPLLVALLAVIFGGALGGLVFVASLALPALPEPLSLIIGIVLGLILGALVGLLRGRRVRGAIGQNLPQPRAAPPLSTARTIVALRLSDPDNISRRSRARAILLNNQGKIDRSVGRHRE